MKIETRGLDVFVLTVETPEEVSALKGLVRRFTSPGISCGECGTAIQSARYKIGERVLCEQCGDAEIFVQREMGKL